MKLRVKKIGHVPGIHVSRIFANKMVILLVALGAFATVICLFNRNQQPYMYIENNSLQNENWNQNNFLVPSNDGLKNYIPVAQIVDLAETYDVEKGSIEYLYNDIGDYEFPICVNWEEMPLWNFTFNVTGGYTPSDWHPANDWRKSRLAFYQKGDYVNAYYMGEWKVEPTDDCGNYLIIWQVDPSACENDWTFDSNQYPDGTTHIPIWEVPGDDDRIPGKEVELKLILNWEGCHLVGQQFEYI